MQPLYVVILNWNQPAATIECVRSLLADGFAAASILVVDNGSTDGSLARMAEALGPSVPILRSDSNLGFAGGCNLGIRRALGEGAAWVLLLNNDTIVQAGFRQGFESALAEHPHFRLWGPLILYQEPADVIWALGDRAVGGTLLTRHIAHRASASNALPPLVEVDYLTGCALMVHADVFDAVGLLDEFYFMYVEDADFCLRARRAGFRLACWTPARVTHCVSLSTGRESARAREWRIGYQARFYRRWSFGSHRALLFAAATVRTTAIVLGDMVRGRREMAAAALRGWREGWMEPIDTPIGRPTLHTSPAGEPALLEGALWKK